MSPRFAGVLFVTLLGAEWASGQVCQCPSAPLGVPEGGIVDGKDINGACIGASVIGSPNILPQSDPQHILWIVYLQSVGYDRHLTKIAAFLEVEMKKVHPASSITIAEVPRTGGCKTPAQLAGNVCTLPDQFVPNVIPADLSPFTQIWINDLEASCGETGATCAQEDVAHRIATTWYDGVANVMGDGRVLSGVYTGATPGLVPTYTNDDWTGVGKSNWPSFGGQSTAGSGLIYQESQGSSGSLPNAHFFVNIFHHAVRAGKKFLYLGTDHNAYVGGINRVNDYLGFNRFFNNYPGPKANVALESGLFTWPTVSSHSPVQQGGGQCPIRQIWDHTSTSQAPSNLQPGCPSTNCPAGVPATPQRFFNPVAYHGTGLSEPAISTTLPTGVGFRVAATGIPCPFASSAGSTVNVDVDILGMFVGNTVVSYSWDFDGDVVCATQACSIELPAGAAGGSHVLTVTVVDSQGFSAASSVCIELQQVECGAAPTIAGATQNCAGAGPFQPGTECTPVCADPSKEVYPAVTCHDGSWVGGTSCEPAVCRSVPSIPNANPQSVLGCSNSVHGTSCAASCASGFTPAGAGTVTCSDGGQWAIDFQCLPDACAAGQFLDLGVGACVACPVGTYKEGTGAPQECTLCPENTFNDLLGIDSLSGCQTCPDGQTSPPGSVVCNAVPPCPLNWGSEHLETSYEPVLDVAASGFSSKDIFTVFFDNPNKFTFQSATIYSNDEQLVDLGIPDNDVPASAPTGPYIGPRACYTRYSLTSTWGDLVDGGVCFRAVEAAQIRYTCKLHVENLEYLDPIRNTDLTRDVISEMPFEVLFPRQVSASISNLSAFQPPNVLAAIIRQEVNVDVNDLSGNLDVLVRLYTSAQWPFKLTAPQFFSAPLDINSDSFALATGGDCSDPALSDTPNPTVLDENACNQRWDISLVVANGAAGAPCELDGDYVVKYQAVCQASFSAQSDCPLVQDDLGEIDNIFTIDFTLDSEYFCPQVVDEVDISAELSVYKDHAHTVDATNFILGQTAYFKAVSSSDKVTIVGTNVAHISVRHADLSQPEVFSLGANPHCDATDAGDKGYVDSLVVEDGGCETAGVNTEAWFQWKVTDAPFSPPVDGSVDFAVFVTLDIDFKDAGLLLEDAPVKRVRRLLQVSGSDKQTHRASTSFKTRGDDSDETTSSANTFSVLGAVSAVAFALQF